MWDQVKSRLEEARFGVRLELRPTDRNLDEYDYVQAKKPNYFPTVVRSASLAFESAFSSEEKLAMLCRRYGGKRVHIRRKDFCLKQIQFNSDVAIDFRKRRDSDRGYWIREALITELSPQKINYHNIFLGIAHADFRMKPVIRHLNFFVGFESGIVFFMYDDRGVLIAAPAKERLPELPSSLNILRHEDLKPNEFIDR
ncbi:MAG: DUF3885 domain-containing protein [Cyanobacteria bacterium P01_D01_bin.73]